MDTFSPPFEPQNPSAGPALPTESVPTIAPVAEAAPAPTPQATPAPAQTSPTASPMSANIATAPSNTWQIVLVIGVVLFLGGVAGYLYLWLR